MLHTRFGIIRWQGRTLYYEPADGGFRAHYIGDSTPVTVGPELRAAIDEDHERQRRKSEGKE